MPLAQSRLFAVVMAQVVAVVAGDLVGVRGEQEGECAAPVRLHTALGELEQVRLGELYHTLGGGFLVGNQTTDAVADGRIPNNALIGVAFGVFQVGEFQKLLAESQGESAPGEQAEIVAADHQHFVGHALEFDALLNCLLHTAAEGEGNRGAVN